MNLLRQGNKFLDLRSKCIVYFAHIISHVSYCLSVWGNMINQQQITQLDKLLLKCRKLISTSKNLCLLTLPLMILLENYKFGYKLIHNMLPIAVSNCAMSDHREKSLVKKHKYNTRKKLIPNQPNVQCAKYNQSIFCKGHRDYAHLSTDIRNTKLFSTFVNKCKETLLAMKS